MNEQLKPYVGVSGFVSKEQQVQSLEYADPLDRVEYRLAMGVKAVHKTQWLDIENKYGEDWYPVGEGIADVLLPAVGDELQVAQVFLEPEMLQAEDGDIYARMFMQKIISRTQPWLNGVQFDMLPWQDNDYRSLLDVVREASPDSRIILQAHGPAMNQLGPAGAAMELKKYQDHVDYVLFDASHGAGRGMDTTVLGEFIEAAKDQGIVNVGVAGGLDQYAVDNNLYGFLKKHPGISFDAEGRLHDNWRSDSNALNPRHVRNYLEAAVRVLRPIQLNKDR